MHQYILASFNWKITSAIPYKNYPGFGDTPESLEVKSFEEIMWSIKLMKNLSLLPNLDFCRCRSATKTLFGERAGATSGGINLKRFNVQDWRVAKHF